MAFSLLSLLINTKHNQHAPARTTTTRRRRREQHAYNYNRKQRQRQFESSPLLPVPHMRSSASMASDSSTQSSSSNVKVDLPSTMSIKTKVVGSEQDIMNVATLRNNCTSPLEMIQQQQLKRDSIDKTQSMLNGLGIGCGIGTLIGIGTYVSSFDLIDSITKSVVVSLVLGGVLGINNAMGNRIYVMTEAEAINRLKVDYVASLLTGQDIGFVAYLTSSSKGKNNDPAYTLLDRYKTGGNFVGCVDCDIRPLTSSSSNNNEVSSLHIKNMYVDPYMRRQGVAKSLLNEVETYGKEQANVQYLTLDVDSKNVGAVQLYQSNGFECIENPKDIGYESKSFIFGRQLLAKQIKR